MVGLSVVLEEYNNNNNNNSTMKSYNSQSSTSTSSSSSNNNSLIIVSKSSMMKTSPTISPKPSSPNPFSRRSFSLPNNRNLHSNGFLDHCLLCRTKLLPAKDIYMYKGDRGFCSEECRCKQIFMDEEEDIKVKRENCSLAASSSSSTSSSTTTRKGATKRANGFAY